MADDTALLQEILQTLDAPQAQYAELDTYYSGVQQMAFLAPEARASLGHRFGRMVVNLVRLQVTSVAERLKVQGWEGPYADQLWTDWLANDLDMLSSSAHREALLLGSAYAVVWSNPDGSPRVSVESARQVTTLADPGSREIYAAVKRWQTATTTEAVLYLPDSIKFYTSNSPGANTAGFVLTNEIENPLSVVPVVQLANSDRIPVGGIAYPDRILDHTHSEVWDSLPLVDALSKVLADMLITSEFVGRPRRYATGIELADKPRVDPDTGQPFYNEAGDPIVDAVNPIPETGRTMVSVNDNAKFGQLDGARLDGYGDAVRTLVSMLQAVSCLPSHYLGVLNAQPPSADGLRAAESSLVARCEEKQRMFGRAWEQVGKLMTAVREGIDPATVDVQVCWGPADSRSEAQQADAAVKLFQTGVLSRTATLRSLGYSDDEIALELTNTRTDAALGADARLGRYLTDTTTDA
jgi:hypothetical protein